MILGRCCAKHPESSRIPVALAREYPARGTDPPRHAARPGAALDQDSQRLSAGRPVRTGSRRTRAPDEGGGMGERGPTGPRRSRAGPGSRTRLRHHASAKAKGWAWGKGNSRAGALGDREVMSYRWGPGSAWARPTDSGWNPRPARAAVCRQPVRVSRTRCPRSDGTRLPDRLPDRSPYRVGYSRPWPAPCPLEAAPRPKRALGRCEWKQSPTGHRQSPR
jgi:hypothetical protein